MTVLDSVQWFVESPVLPLTDSGPSMPPHACVLSISPSVYIDIYFLIDIYIYIYLFIYLAAMGLNCGRWDL